MRQAMTGFWDGSGISTDRQYADNLHLAPDRQSRQHLINQLLQARCSSWHPTNSVRMHEPNSTRTSVLHEHVQSTFTSLRDLVRCVCSQSVPSRSTWRRALYVLCPWPVNARSIISCFLWCFISIVHAAFVPIKLMMMMMMMMIG